MTKVVLASTSCSEEFEDQSTELHAGRDGQRMNMTDRLEQTKATTNRAIHADACNRHDHSGTDRFSEGHLTTDIPSTDTNNRGQLFLNISEIS